MSDRKKEYHEYLQTDYWKEVSRMVRERAGNRCQLCNGTKILQAHHRTYANRGNEKEHLDDLICLCKRCHQKHHDIAPERPTKKQRKFTKKQLRRQEAKRAMLVRVPVMPTTQTVTLTMALIDNCKTKRGAFTRATEQALGSDGKHGWKKRLVGKILTIEDYRMAVDARERGLAMHEPEN